MENATMKIKNKDNGYELKVQSEKNKILAPNGFVIILGNDSYYSADRVRADIIESNFVIPENVTIG